MRLSLLSLLLTAGSLTLSADTSEALAYKDLVHFLGIPLLKLSKYPYSYSPPDGNDRGQMVVTAVKETFPAGLRFHSGACVINLRKVISDFTNKLDAWQNAASNSANTLAEDFIKPYRSMSVNEISEMPGTCGYTFPRLEGTLVTGCKYVPASMVKGIRSVINRYDCSVQVHFPLDSEDDLPKLLPSKLLPLELLPPKSPTAKSPTSKFLPPALLSPKSPTAKSPTSKLPPAKRRTWTQRILPTLPSWTRPRAKTVTERSTTAKAQVHGLPGINPEVQPRRRLSIAPTDFRAPRRLSVYRQRAKTLTNSGATTKTSVYGLPGRTPRAQLRRPSFTASTELLIPKRSDSRPSAETMAAPSATDMPPANGLLAITPVAQQGRPLSAASTVHSLTEHPFAPRRRAKTMTNSGATTVEQVPSPSDTSSEAQPSRPLSTASTARSPIENTVAPRRRAMTMTERSATIVEPAHSQTEYTAPRRRAASFNG